jgi:putative ABC transport system substrate-binding protein
LIGVKPPIQILLSSGSDIYLEGLGGIQSVLNQKSEVLYLDAFEDSNLNLAEYFQKVEESSPDLYITVGSKATKIASKYLKKTPIIFSLVSMPLPSGLERGNTCGFSMDVSVSSYFKALKEISPKLKYVVAFYSAPQGRYLAGEGLYFRYKYNLFYKIIEINQETTLPETLNNYKGKVDAIYMVPDVIYNSENFNFLSKFCRKKGIILMTNFQSLIKSGATFGYSPSYARLGVRTGELANKILNKETSCHDEGIKFPNYLTFLLNEKYAEQSGISLPESVRERAKETKKINIGIILFNKGNLQLARAIFQELVDKNPNNKVASAYLNLIIEKSTINETKHLFKEAADNLQKQNYINAAKLYRQILKINENSISAQQGLSKSIFLQSEKIRIKAVNLQKLNKSIRAIKAYIKSLKILPSNSKSQQGLKNLRSTQRKKIPQMLKKGIHLYRQRNYTAAIYSFQNILTIQPNQKEGIEYLRLSKKKKIAIDNLKKNK